jgi:hypothetical protein
MTLRPPSEEAAAGAAKAEPETGNESQLIEIIKAHVRQGDKYAEKVELNAEKRDGHYIAAGQHLKTLKARHGGNWAEWENLLKTKIGIGKSRASELMLIADGTKTVEEVRAEGAARKAKERAKKFLRDTEKVTENADRQKCIAVDAEVIALDAKAIDSAREFAQWLVDHPHYSAPVIAEWLNCEESRIKSLRQWAKGGFQGPPPDHR